MIRLGIDCLSVTKPTHKLMIAGHATGITAVHLWSTVSGLQATVRSPIRLWDWQNGRALGEPLTGHEYPIHKVMFRRRASPDFPQP